MVPGSGLLMVLEGNAPIRVGVEDLYFAGATVWVAESARSGR